RTSIIPSQACFRRWRSLWAARWRTSSITNHRAGPTWRRRSASGLSTRLAILPEGAARLPVVEIVAPRVPIVMLAAVRDSAAAAFLTAAEVPADAAAHQGARGGAAPRPASEPARRRA